MLWSWKIYRLKFENHAKNMPIPQNYTKKKKIHCRSNIVCENLSRHNLCIFNFFDIFIILSNHQCNGISIILKIYSYFIHKYKHHTYNRHWNNHLITWLFFDKCVFINQGWRETRKKKFWTNTFFISKRIFIWEALSLFLGYILNTFTT